MAEDKVAEEKVDVVVSEKLQKIIDEIGNLSVLELADLVKALEDTFGVSAAAPVAMMGAMPAGAGEAAAAQTEFDAILTAVGDKKIQVIKVVREVTGLGLKESKEIVDSAPKAIKTAISEDDANGIKAKLEEVGASVEIK